MQSVENSKRRFTAVIGLLGAGALYFAAGPSALATTAFDSIGSLNVTSLPNTGTDTIGDTASLTSVGQISTLKYTLGWVGDNSSAFPPTTNILTGVTVTLNLYADSGAGNHEGALLGSYVQTLTSSQLDDGFGAAPRNREYNNKNRRSDSIRD